ncbi:phosphate regulon sensor histidine kinase PhoR [Uliginosibacterium silvisoli]|uniref:phosphate regulon sensor histidine kinase PhoR n=1 Tax=Uliginosibacterium silvisoli TaxID=3114758 RepID=UPI003A7F437E
MSGLFIAAGFVWAFFGGLAAALVTCFGLLAIIVYHLRNLGKLMNWAREPLGTPTPHAWGTWDHVFAALSRHSRVAYDQRERLSQTLARFREAAQAMPDGVIYLTRQNTIEWVNVAAQHHFGLDATRDVGTAISNLVRQPDFVGYVERGEYQEPLVFKPVRNDSLTLSMQIVPFGEDLKMLLSRDISQLEKLENMRRDFVANVSHELKTPLTVVSGFVEMLHDGLEDFSADDARRYLNLASEQAVRMQRLIEDLLALSALETGAPMPVEDKVDVHGLLRSVAQEAELLSAGRHRVTVKRGAGATLIGSQKEIHSVLANLASNAVRYTPEGGEICLIWQTTHEGAELAVQDNGPGIEAQHLPRLTERFYRVDRGRSRESGGTGLGLAIVKHVMTRHQGTLEIQSEPGRGSRFAAHFPARRVIKLETEKAGE